MDPNEEKLREFFRNSGANEVQAATLASQALKRARQLSRERGWTEIEAMRHLLEMFIEAQQR